VRLARFTSLTTYTVRFPCDWLHALFPVGRTHKIKGVRLVDFFVQMPSIGYSCFIDALGYSADRRARRASISENDWLIIASVLGFV
jgi:hypothetical protein